MQTSKLKSYAPKARRDFIAAVIRRAAAFGLSAQAIEPSREEGQLVIIAGQAHPRAVGRQRQRLAERIRQQGFTQVMEAAAYTWFNRFAAIRFMELHGYLDHSFRVLSHPAAQGASGFLPEILEQAQHVELPGLDRERVIALKMDGTQDEALYRDLLLAQCRALHQAMPFLFEPLDDETELLLPDRLLQTDSLIRELVTAIPEEDWQEIEIIGWLYQFYISEKKDQVIGKVVKSEDIPAATQLFTPNWTVKYMVQNSLGAQWLATYPDSPLKAQMEYYIEPAEQTPEVQAQLAAITPQSLNPEELTLMDPACGSGHILVEAYDLFKAIYLERGYRLRDIPRLILEKNLYGLDIDERAAQLAGFALMMKARADDRRLLEQGVKLNVMALVDSTNFDVELVAHGVVLGDYGLKSNDLTDIKRIFERTTTFGSLIQVPEELAVKLSALKRLSVASSRDLFIAEALGRLEPLARQAELLSKRYDTVVSNPPYMGSMKGMNPELKEFINATYPDAKFDLYAAFISRAFELLSHCGYLGFVTMHGWMFLAYFENFRKNILARRTVLSLAHLGPRAFPEISGEVVQTSMFAAFARNIQNHVGTYLRAINGEAAEKAQGLASGSIPEFFNTATDFLVLPGAPIAYWISLKLRGAFFGGRRLDSYSPPKKGMTTSDNQRFLRIWHEVSLSAIGIGCKDEAEAHVNRKKWIPYNKGGEFRRWFGNCIYVINWADKGREVVSYAAELYGSPSRQIQNTAFYFMPSISWSSVSANNFCARSFDKGFIFDGAGPSIFPEKCVRGMLLGFLNSKVATNLMAALNPTMNFVVGNVASLPIPEDGVLRIRSAVDRLVTEAEAVARVDWDAKETSWGFQMGVCLAEDCMRDCLADSWIAWSTAARDRVLRLAEIECEVNSLFIRAYDLQDELNPVVPIEQITLTANPSYRYGGKLSEEEQWTRFRQDTMQELVSYAIGCGMGRYSLDEPGLIYAHSGNVGFDPSRYATLPADADGIIPITETDWFDDDATHRVVEFISVAWDRAHLEENLQFLADNLSPKRGESSRDTLRRYLADKFFKDHLQTYKRRPIYWCFSSGKQKAFQCLVYLHRYHEGTLARMRMEYLVPLQSKMAARIDNLAEDIQSASTSAQAKRLQKERDILIKQLDELRRYDEQLRHYADRRISLDLDDGVKVNYGKFGDLLAEVKTVTGTSAD